MKQNDWYIKTKKLCYNRCYNFAVEENNEHYCECRTRRKPQRKNQG